MNSFYDYTQRLKREELGKVKRAVDELRGGLWVANDLGSINTAKNTVMLFLRRIHVPGVPAVYMDSYSSRFQIRGVFTAFSWERLLFGNREDAAWYLRELVLRRRVVGSDAVSRSSAGTSSL